MRRTTRGEAILNKMVHNPSHPLTQAGKDWLIQVCDPFHDKPFQKTGWPDNNSRPSIVRQVKQSMAISATSGGLTPAPTVPFDVHIAWLPALVPQVSIPMTGRFNNSVTVNNTTQLNAIGGLTAILQPASGAPANWLQPAGSVDTLGQLSVDSSYLLGDTRLVGVGFEVTDTSAEINKQGMITIYSYPQGGPTDLYIETLSAPTVSLNMTPFLGRRVILPPTNVADALLLPESKQWESRFGAYMVPTFQDIHNPATEVDCIVPVWEQQLTAFSPTATNTALGAVPVLPINSTSANIAGTQSIIANTPAYNKIAPMNTCGVILSGCNPNSTFVCTLVYYIETIPRANDKPSVVLTQPAPEFDPFALQLYGMILNHLPPGCMVGENDDGNWFWNIVEKVSEVAAPILGLIPHPLAQGAAVLAQGANKIARKQQTQNMAITATPTKGPRQDSTLRSEPKKKRKKVKKQNLALASGSRGKKGKIQGPMRR